MRTSARLAVTSVLASAATLGVPEGHTAPRCAHPAPLYDGSRTTPQGFTVILKASVKDPKAITALLEKKRNFTVTEYWWYGPAVSAAFFVFDVQPSLIDTLRCETQVRSVRYDVLVHISAMAPNPRLERP
jgi:hypothetical protein